MVFDIGQGFNFRPGTLDAAISNLAVQWLCNADKTRNDPHPRLKAFFSSLYKCLATGAFANISRKSQTIEIISTAAILTGLSWGLVVDLPYRPPSVSNTLPKAKGEDGEDSESDGDDRDEEEGAQVDMLARQRPDKRMKHNKAKTKGKA